MVEAKVLDARVESLEVEALEPREETQVGEMRRGIEAVEPWSSAHEWVVIEVELYECRQGSEALVIRRSIEADLVVSDAERRECRQLTELLDARAREKVVR